MQSKKTILYFVPHYLPGFKSGGVVRSVNNFVENLGDEFDIKIISNDHDVKSKEPYKNVKINQWNNVGKAKVFYSSKQNIYSLFQKAYEVLGPSGETLGVL